MTLKVETLIPVTYFESLRDFKSGTYAHGNSAFSFALFLAKLDVETLRIVYGGDCVHRVQECSHNVDECHGLSYVHGSRSVIPYSLRNTFYISNTHFQTKIAQNTTLW